MTRVSSSHTSFRVWFLLQLLHHIFKHLTCLLQLLIKTIHLLVDTLKFEIQFTNPILHLSQSASDFLNSGTVWVSQTGIQTSLTERLTLTHSLCRYCLRQIGYRRGKDQLRRARYFDTSGVGVWQRWDWSSRDPLDDREDADNFSINVERKDWGFLPYT